MILKNILKTVKSHNTYPEPLLVFDLDSTVFDVSPRTEQILKDFANSPEFIKKYPLQTTALKHIKVRSTDWGIKQALIRLKVEGTIEFFEDIRNFWVSHFFSNGYLHYDRPYDGVIEFIQAVENNGARIIYLTGRDIVRMGEGSKKVILSHNLPLDGNHHKLILKPQQGMSDSEFKRDVFKQLVQHHQRIWFFENEPVNLKLVEKAFPEVNLVFIDSVHSNRQPSPEHLPKISMKFEF